MNTRDMVQRSIHIITEYYRNNLKPFFDMIDADVLWYGPAEGQFLQGRETILRTWAGERHALTFTMGNITARSISGGSAACEVILSYPVATHYPSGTTITVNQHIHFSWAERRLAQGGGATARQPRIIVIHITNPYHQNDKDNIYPTHLDEIRTPGFDRVFLGTRRLELRGRDGSLYFLYPESIGWIESAGRGKHSCLHMLGGERLELQPDVAALEPLTAPYLIRVHQSYLVNPRCVKRLERFRLTLSDGTLLPIPEKKYTRVRALLSGPQER